MNPQHQIPLLLHQLTNWLNDLIAINILPKQRPEQDSHTYRNGTFEAHPHTDTINLLLLPSIQKLDSARALTKLGLEAVKS